MTDDYRLCRDHARTMCQEMLEQLEAEHDSLDANALALLEAQFRSYPRPVVMAYFGGAAMMVVRVRMALGELDPDRLAAPISTIELLLWPEQLRSLRRMIAVARQSESLEAIEATEEWERLGKPLALADE